MRDVYRAKDVAITKLLVCTHEAMIMKHSMDYERPEDLVCQRGSRDVGAED